MKSWKLITLVPGHVVFGLAFFSVVATAQVDPGARAGSSTAAPVSGLTRSQLNAFNAAMASFQEVEDVAHSALGPRFNSNSCVSCHAQPAAGGSSPTSNPQTAFADSQNSAVVHPAQWAGP